MHDHRKTEKPGNEKIGVIPLDKSKIRQAIQSSSVKAESAANSGKPTLQDAKKQLASIAGMLTKYKNYWDGLQTIDLMGCGDGEFFGEQKKKTGAVLANIEQLEGLLGKTSGISAAREKAKSIMAMLTKYETYWSDRRFYALMSSRGGEFEGKEKDTVAGFIDGLNILSKTIEQI
ncbi:MAG: hypothetical protein NT051_03190 [Candidatus Micrarchaeota archaeon]|nr:hypothetical protein [Candidatus Micrarchaeota archaeon]